ncbi:MAG: hypothetical protein DMG75_03630, partial [Acidobacteria bacterium]
MYIGCFHRLDPVTGGRTMSHPIRNERCCLRTVYTFGLLFLLVLACGLRLAGQVESGKVVGTVRDSTGAVLAGAKVTVTNVETNVARSLISNNSGDYVVTELQPGTYTVTAELEGF